MSNEISDNYRLDKAEGGQQVKWNDWVLVTIVVNNITQEVLNKRWLPQPKSPSTDR